MLTVNSVTVNDESFGLRDYDISDIITDMPQLIVRQIEEKVVKKLKARAGLHGVSMEEEHRQILREALLGGEKKGSFKAYLLSMPDVGPDSAFERMGDQGRKLEL